jgi:uncharacterized protein YjbI with pentapeptide repeats
METSSDELRRLTAEELTQALAEHEKWLDSKQKAGKCINLESVDLKDVKWPGKNLRGAKLANADFHHADLSDAILDAADLSGANLVGANLTRASLRAANLSRAYCENTEMPGADLSLAKLRGAFMWWANLSGCDLGSADFRPYEQEVVAIKETQLHRANLTNAKAVNAWLSHANLSFANLTGADLHHAKFDGADLRGAVGAQLDSTYIREAQFSPVSSRWLAWVCNTVFPRLRRRCQAQGWDRLARQLGIQEKKNDSWSVLRQSYAGPRLFFLFLFVIAFTLPYVGRAVFYSAVGPVERRLAAQVESRKQKLEAKLAARPTDLIARHELEQINHALAKVEPRPLWQVLLKWDEGKIGPSVLAVLLILYNLGLYILISSVSPLRDEEERSGWSPARADYAWLIWIHRVVTGLFYVSLVSFMINATQVLTDVVFVVKPG